MSAYSFLTGMLTGGVALAVALWLWRTFIAGRKIPLGPVGLMAGGLVAIFALAAGVLYLTIARPHAAVSAAQAPAPHAVPSGDASSQAQSMETATAGLAARLARGGGSDQDWELLAKSYDFMGRAEDAKLAREHKVSPAAIAAAGAAASSSTPSLAQATPPSTTAEDAALRDKLEQKLKSNPKDVNALLDLAALDQSQRQYAQAREHFQKVVALKGMTSDAWADYADVLAAIAGGSLSGEPAQAIEHALALDPKNEKALWLKASFALQEHRYPDALALWKTLRASLPAGSPDISEVDSNIAEAAQLAGTGGGAPAPEKPAAGATNVAVSGTVSIDSKLASQVSKDAILFIYARAADEQGPPLAVMRLQAGSWPVSFRLDDSLAMMPARRLSQFDKVVVEARVSRSGQAAPSSGDLYVKSDVIRPADGKKLTLVINQKIT